MKDRLTQFLQSEQLSPARFADILGVQRSGISHILSGRNKPGFDFIEKIVIKFPNINAEWLITGKGKMYKESPPPPPTQSTSASVPAHTLSPSLQPEHRIDSQSIKNNSLLPEIPTVKQTAPPEKTVTGERSISKIIILYTDKSFSEYHPE